MKKIGLFLVILAAAVGLWAWGGFYDQALTWGTAESSTATLVQAGACTASVFQLAEGEGRGDRFINKLGIYAYIDEINDSTYVYFAIDLSPDGTNWYNAVVYPGTTTTADAAVCYSVAGSSLKPMRYARIRAIGKMAAGDTVQITNAYVSRVFTE